MKLKDLFYKKKLIKKLNKELDYVLAFQRAVYYGDDIVKDENVIKKYEQSKTNLENVKNELFSKYGKDFIL